MKIKNYQVITAYELLSNLLNNNHMIDIKTKFALLPKYKQLSAEKAMVEDARKMLVIKYGEKKDDGSVTVEDEDKEKQFQKEYAEVLNMDCNNEIDGFTLDEIGSLFPTMEELLGLEAVIVK